MSTGHLEVRKRREGGFTLVELMMVIVVLAILVGIALPAYQDYIRKSNRAVAKGKLLELASMQEQYFGDYKVYANTLDLFFSFGDAEVGVDSGYTFVDKDSTDSIYTISVTTSAVGTIQRMAYTLTAVPRTGSSQAADSHCASFSIDNTGLKTATHADCWD